MKQAGRIISKLVNSAGVVVNGDHPWDIQVHDERLYRRVLRDGSLGFGEAYIDGWWDAEWLDATMYRLLRADIRSGIRSVRDLIEFAGSMLLNKARLANAYEVGDKHYDLGNDLFNVMLDSRMVYTCGYWNQATTLEEAQEAKLDLVCRKIGLKSGDRVLDIGCGWGSFLQFAAEHYGARGLGITISKEQVVLAQENVTGLPVEIRLQDYRKLREEEPFDQIVSLGMFEHVGYKNFRVFMDIVAQNLRSDGLFLLHTIGNDKTVRSTDAWIGKYIFPNSMLPSIRQIGKAIEGHFIMEDWHNFSADYDKTLMAWHDNFERGWDTLKADYDERFYRMWRYYLLFCAGSFRARKVQLWQIVLSKNGIPGGYSTIR